MSPGERAVWAAEFTRALQEGYSQTACVRIACDAVDALRRAAQVCPLELTAEQRAMLAAMVSP